MTKFENLRRNEKATLRTIEKEKKKKPSRTTRYYIREFGKVLEDIQKQISDLCIWVVVYKDTINPEHNGDNNLSEILIPEELFQEYYSTEISPENYEDYEAFKAGYTADETQGLYQMAVEKDMLVDAREI